MTFGPIAPLAYGVYGSSLDINLLQAWGPIIYLPATIFASWLLDKASLKTSMVLNTALVAIGGVLRCIIYTAPVANYLAHAAQIFNAIAGPFCMSAPPLLSAIWFPLKDRTFTTAIGALGGNFGIVFSFTTGLYVKRLEDVPILMVSEAAASTLLLALTLAYFPATPFDTHPCTSLFSREAWTSLPLAGAPGEPAQPGQTPLNTASVTTEPPTSETQAIKEGDTPVTPVEEGSTSQVEASPTQASGFNYMTLLSFWRDVVMSFKRPAFVVASLALGCTAGVFYGWQAVLLLVLQPLGFSQVEVGWMGFLGTLLGCFSGLLASRVADWTGRYMKPVYLTLFSGLTICSLLFCLFAHEIISTPNKDIVVYVLVVLATIFLCGLVPVLYELAVDITYPITPSTSCSITNTLINVICMVFILCGDALSSQALNWTLVGTSGLFTLAMITLKCKYHRT
eukprot:TRINITY_DN692_c0_g5_i1.p1 TRINITY_DN692_c0_g5~~TRINITY_DN692_c0_g5_i1.p1  ORF type:complete len:483 (-),score=72.54 TRINITY_DN692_c0_g5_i1:76-1434(-)